MTKYKLRHISSGQIIEFRNKSMYEYCLSSASYEICKILSDLDNSGEFEPIIEEIKEKENLKKSEKRKDFREEKEYKKIEFKKVKK